MLTFLPEPNAGSCRRLLDAERERFTTARGSTHNHQTWDGGYLDHVRETMNYAILFHRAESSTRRTPAFGLADALLALFLHDLEKPWRFEKVGGEWRNTDVMKSKDDRAAFRWRKIADAGILLTPEIVNAVTYAEGEGGDYRPDRRVANELAGFVHMMDVMSARVRHDYPKSGDPWSRR
jgi:hypothetical protein